VPKHFHLKRIHYILLLFLFIPFQSCEEEGSCTGVEVARVGAGFYVRHGDIEKDTILDFFTLHSAGNPDSLIYDSAANLQAIRFPLPNEEESHSRFVFKAGSGTDTLHIYKQSRLVLVSYACGFAANHYLQKAEGQGSIIDTVAITIADVAFFNEENIKIYITPAVADSTR
jgi:hypothetical protein